MTNEWEDDKDWQEFLDRQVAMDKNEEAYGIYTVGGLTNDKEGGFMKFVNKTTKKWKWKYNSNWNINKAAKAAEQNKNK